MNFQHRGVHSVSFCQHYCARYFLTSRCIRLPHVMLISDHIMDNIVLAFCPQFPDESSGNFIYLYLRAGY
jgi:hypothetical protein